MPDSERHQTFWYVVWLSQISWLALQFNQVILPTDSWKTSIGQLLALFDLYTPMRSIFVVGFLLWHWRPSVMSDLLLFVYWQGTITFSHQNAFLSMWLLSGYWIFCLTTLQWVGVTRISKAVHLMVWFFCLLVSGKTHVGIVWVLRRHRLQMQPQQTINENIRKQREARISRNILLIVGVYFLLNTPVLLAKIYHQILQQDIKTYNHFSWTETLAFLNSCTNPMICFWKNRQVRQGVLTMLKTICCYN